jgi:hypothetical protein
MSVLYSVLELVQYAAIYLFAALGAGVALDTLFPRFESKKGTHELLTEVVLQCLALVVIVFFIRMYVTRVPILFVAPKGSNYVPYGTTEYGGEMMMGLVFLGSQMNLVRKIDELSGRFYKALYARERAVERSL